jgi:hypothetical protein
LLLLVGAFGFLGCQQTQEADDDAEGTTVIEEDVDMPAPDVDVEPAPDAPDMQMDVDVQGEGEGGVSGEVQTN